MAKKTAVMKETATPSKKRKAGEDLEEVSAAVRDVAKEATSTIYKKRKVEAKAKAEAVTDTKPIESEATVSLGKKRKATDALESDAARAVVHGDDAPSAKRRRMEDEPIVETEPLEEETTVPSGEKAKKSKDDEVFDPQDLHPGVAHMYPQALSPSKPIVSPANLFTPRAPMKLIPGVHKTSGWGRVSVIAFSVQCHPLTENSLHISLPK